MITVRLDRLYQSTNNVVYKTVISLVKPTESEHFLNKTLIESPPLACRGRWCETARKEGGARLCDVGQGSMSQESLNWGPATCTSQCHFYLADSFPAKQRASTYIVPVRSASKQKQVAMQRLQICNHEMRINILQKLLAVEF